MKRKDRRRLSVEPAMATSPAPSVEDDEIASDVMAQAVAGDDRAFASLIRHHDRRLRALAYRILGDRNRMDDVLQEAYVKAYRALPTFRSESKPGAWLYRIVYNACIDDLRRTSRRPLSLWDEPPEVAATGPDLSDRHAMRSSLEAALARLSPGNRAVVLLVDVDGFDYPEAAEILGVAPGTVGSRLSRARAAMRASLEEGDVR